MAYFLTTASYGVTGVKTVTCGFQPLAARITVGSKTGGQTYAHKSVGVTDGTNQVCDWWYQDATRGNTNRNSDRMVNQVEWDSGTSAWVTKTRSNFDSFTATEFKHNVVTADSNYQYLIEVWG